MKRKPMPPVSLVYPEQIHKVQSIAELLRQLDDLMLRSSLKNLVQVERKIDLIHELMAALDKPTLEQFSILKAIKGPIERANSMLKQSSVTSCMLHWMKKWYSSHMTGVSLELNSAVDTVFEPPVEQSEPDRLSAMLNRLKSRLKAVTTLVRLLPDTSEDARLLEQVKGVETVLSKLEDNHLMICSLVKPSLSFYLDELATFESRLDAILASMLLPDIHLDDITVNVELQSLLRSPGDAHEFKSQLQTYIIDFETMVNVFTPTVEEKDTATTSDASDSTVPVEEVGESMLPSFSGVKARLLIHDTQYEFFNQTNARAEVVNAHKKLAQLAHPGGIMTFDDIEVEELDSFIFNLKEEICSACCRIPVVTKNKLLARIDDSVEHLRRGETVSLDLKDSVARRPSRLESVDHASVELHRFLTSDQEGYQSIDDKIINEVQRPGLSSVSAHSNARDCIELTLCDIAVLRQLFDEFNLNPTPPLAESIMTKLAGLEYLMVKEATTLVGYKIACLYYASLDRSYMLCHDNLERVLTHYREGEGESKQTKWSRYRFLDQDYAGVRKMARQLIESSKTVRDFKLLKKSIGQGHERAKGKVKEEEKICQKIEKLTCGGKGLERQKRAARKYCSLFDDPCQGRANLSDVRKLNKVKRDIGL